MTLDNVLGEMVRYGLWLRVALTFKPDSTPITEHFESVISIYTRLHYKEPIAYVLDV